VKSAPKRVSRRPVQPGAAGWDVVVVDGKPLRKKAQRDYQKTVRDVEAAKAETERFHNEDKPLFSRWMASNFGALLTEIRDLQLKLFEAQNLVDEVQQEYHFGSHRSIASAYRQVLNRREHPEKAEPEEEIDAEEAEEFSREFEEAFGKTAEEFWEQLGQGARQKGAATRQAKTAKSGNRLKELYRTLARRLHPDKGHAVSAKEKEWWHQTQAAYEEGNIEQLEMIFTLLEVEDKGTKEASVSTLQQLTAAFKKTLRTLKRQLTELRRDIAWNFSRRSDRSALFQQTRLSLQTDRDKILWLLHRYEAQIGKWQALDRETSTSRKRVRARRSNWMDEEWF
jgi:hypothetical protein